MAAPNEVKPSDQQKREVVRMVQHEDLRKLRQFLKSQPQEGPAPLLSDSLDASGNTILHLAVLSGFEDGVDILLRHPMVDLNAMTNWQETALHLAVENEFNSIAKSLLVTNRCNLNLTTKRKGETALHVAARVGNIFATRELLAFNFNAHATDSEGNTALHLAVLKRRCDITKQLLLAGLDPKAKNGQQKTPLFIAMRDLNDQRLTELLVSIKRTPVATTAAGRRPQDSGVTPTPNKWNHAGNRPRRPEGPIFQTEVPDARPRRGAHRPNQRAQKEKAREVKEEKEEKELVQARRELKSAGVQACAEDEADEDEILVRHVGNDFYKMDAKPRGICLIFNNETYWHDQFEERSGAEVDENRLNALFHRLNFKVKIHKNLNAAEMFWEVMNIARNTDHSNYDCFVCCILSHGSLGTIYGVDGDSFRISELTIALTARRCPSLAGKPKLFFIQACRGEDVQGLLDDQHAHDAQVGSEQARMVPDHADFLLGYATVAGYRAQRHKQNGSLYVQTLCNYVHALHKEKDLLSILTKVNAETASRVFESPNGARFKQMPEVRHTLTRTILFR